MCRAPCIRRARFYIHRMGLPENFAAIQQRIHDACAHVGRAPDSVMLLAVSKGMPPELVNEAAQLGQVFFGESKVQEAKAKIPLCSSRARWQMIGHLQSNKCRDAVQLFEMIQSVDSLALAQELNKWADKFGKRMPILLEVNSGEATKFGFKHDTLLEQVEAVNALPRLEIHGLMTIAPWTPEPEKVRPVFRALRTLKESCEQRLGVPLPHLSMGMSGDFEIAIEEGATLVRVGTALFGTRPKPAKPVVFDDGP
jgi:pyridoxal phosphate enzyme (YggS family)